MPRLPPRPKTKSADISKPYIKKRKASAITRGTYPELKTVDRAVTTTDINTTGAVVLLNGLSLGTDYSNRIGRKVYMTSVQFSGYVQADAAAVATGAAVTSYTQQVRLLIVYDRQPNGAAPAVTDVLTVAAPQAQLNLNNRDRFKILFDKHYVFGPVVAQAAAPTITTASEPLIYNFNPMVKMTLPTIFNGGNAGTVADMSTGSLYLVAVGTTAAGTTDANLVASSRVRFFDA